MSIIDFLKPDTAQIRHQIRGILDSYSHEWDLLSELAQNSVDAIRESGVEKGRIELSINALTRQITLIDNGSGIDPKHVEKLLRPFGSGKVGKANQIGEKGVGLKFVIFSSCSFRLTTRSAEGACCACIEGAAGWVQSTSDEVLNMDLEESSSDEKYGTSIEITVNDGDHPIFDFSTDELVFFMRTKTALGDTGFIWDTPLIADVLFTHIDKGGVKSTKVFDCKYLLPTGALKANDTEKIEGFEAWLKEGDRSDQDKRKKLMNKVVWTVGKTQQSGRTIRYWSCFVPKREFWKKMSQSVGLLMNDEETLPNEDLPGIGFTGGLQTSTKGMPTGISLELRPRGSAGYVPNFFMLVDDPSLKFDIGRKSIHGRQQGMLREVAYKSFREYINTARKYMGGDIDPDLSQWSKDELFEEVEGLPDLNSPVSRFLKRPNSQEATVAAIFFELVGKGKFADLKPLISGYKGRYDLYAKWKARRVVLEFKYDLSGLFKDFNEERKMFNEINTVIVWEVTEADRGLAARRGIAIDKVEASDLVESPSFPHATQQLRLGDVTPIYVVELKSMVA